MRRCACPTSTRSVISPPSSTRATSVPYALATQIAPSASSVQPSGAEIGELGPDPPVLERAVGTDVERGVAPTDRLAHDQRAPVGGDHAAVRELQVVGDHLDGAVGPDEPERGVLALAPRRRRRSRSCRRRRCRRPTPPCRCSARSRCPERSPCSPTAPSVSTRRTFFACIDTTSIRPSGNHPRPLGWSSSSRMVSRVAVDGDRRDAVLVEVGVPEPAVVPARAFAEVETGDQRLQFGHSAHHPLAGSSPKTGAASRHRAELRRGRRRSRPTAGDLAYREPPATPSTVGNSTAFCAALDSWQEARARGRPLGRRGWTQASFDDAGCRRV